MAEGISKERGAIRSDTIASVVSGLVAGLCYAVGAGGGMFALGIGGIALGIPGVLIGNIAGRSLSGRPYSAFERDQDVRLAIAGTLLSGVVVGAWIAYQQGLFDV